ncbi:hypothetical protein [Morganella morganii]|uniref:hypothetical protein n=1 Tax=Morganella morganii TaxID=582 RepID=UPI002023953A|nr:hypothetical protein [Morganella morganii]
MKLGTYERPKYWGVDGVIGDIYYYPDYTLFFRLKYNGSPSDKNWYYPKKAVNNQFWDWVGCYPGTMSEPKTWREPGIEGCIYYEPEYGYLRLKKDGNPSEHKWYFPSDGNSNEYWDFIDFRAGNPVDPKSWDVDEGQEGDYFYSSRLNSFFILKKMVSHLLLTGIFRKMDRIILIGTIWDL